MANVAEGFERGGNREFHNFLSIAKGSCGELESHLVVALDQNYVTPQQYHMLVEMIREESRVIWGLMQSLSKSSFRGVKYKNFTRSSVRKSQS
jgi:four helix bundle protein